MHRITFFALMSFSEHAVSIVYELTVYSALLGSAYFHSARIQKQFTTCS